MDQKKTELLTLERLIKSKFCRLATRELGAA